MSSATSRSMRRSGVSAIRCGSAGTGAEVRSIRELHRVLADGFAAVRDASRTSSAGNGPFQDRREVPFPVASGVLALPAHQTGRNQHAARFAALGDVSRIDAAARCLQSVSSRISEPHSCIFPRHALARSTGLRVFQRSDNRYAPAVAGYVRGIYSVFEPLASPRNRVGVTVRASNLSQWVHVAPSTNISANSHVSKH